MVELAQSFSTSEIGFAVSFIEPTDQFEPSLLEHRDRCPTRHQTIAQQDISGTKDIPQSATQRLFSLALASAGGQNRDARRLRRPEK